MPFSWLDTIDSLTQQNLTVREATRLAENPLDLRYRVIFPRLPTASIKIADISLVDFRPNGGRREWNAQGREIPENVGPQRNWEMVPINPTHHINEREMQLLSQAGVQELTRRGIITAVDRWPTVLADASERQLEADAFEEWYTGILTVMDPKSGGTVTVDLGYGTSEYPVAGTDWDDPGEDAYVNFLAAVQAAQSKFGSDVGVARTHRTVVAAIVADAPDGANGLRPTVSSLQERVREEGFPNVTIVIDERTYDKFTDGGSATSSTFYVPDGLIAFQPANGIVGNTHVAPVARAYDFLNGGNRSLANGIVIFRSEKNDGKTLLIEAQQNALTIPDINRTYVVDTGIAR